IVRNVRAVYPHVEVWFGEYPDLLVLGSARPLSYDSTWVRSLVGPTGALGDLAREWLNIDTPAEYLGHRLLGERGVSGLLTLARFAHTDDQPRLEFAAARSFLAPGNSVAAVFDSLAQIGAASGDGAPALLLARTLAVPPGAAAVLPYLEALRRAEPVPGEYTERDARVRLGLRDTVSAEGMLSSVSS